MIAGAKISGWSPGLGANATASMKMTRSTRAIASPDYPIEFSKFSIKNVTWRAAAPAKSNHIPDTGRRFMEAQGRISWRLKRPARSARAVLSFGEMTACGGGADDNTHV